MIEATITGDKLVLAHLEKLPSNLRKAISDSVRRQWFRIQAEVVRGKLSGVPLHRRTGNLASSINVGGTDTATSFEESDTEVTGRIGTKVRYGAVHEYGGTFTVKEYQRRVTSRLLGEHEVTVKAHNVTYPQRSFLRSTLADMRPSVLEAIRADVARAAKEG